jgi:hypothetical protein
MSRTITLEWKMHPVQRDAFEATERYRTCAWGRRTGKNIFANIDQIDFATNPGQTPYGDNERVTCWWVGPTYNQANKYGFDTAREMIPRALLDTSKGNNGFKREKPREIYLANGATIEYRTFDHPDSLDGAGVDHMVIDEAAMMPETIWHQTLRPMLSDTLGKALFISKPKGKNWFYDHFLRGESDEWPDWWSSQAASYVNPWVPDSEIDAAARELPDRVFKQEYLAVFLDDSGGVFREVRDRNVVEYDWQERNGNAPYVHGWDFARHQNWTVGITLDRDGMLVNFERVQPPSWPSLQRKIEAVYQRYPGVVRVDASRDNKLVTDLEDNGVPVDAVKFSSASKRELVENLAQRLEAGEITFPDIPQLVNELELFEYSTTPSGNVRYHAPEGWNDDCVDALALAARRSNRADSATWGPGRGVSA